MNLHAQELERRRPVWDALSAIFLDNQIDEAQREKIVHTLVASGYSDAELERIVWRELCPVLGVNLLSTAGEWIGFDLRLVEQQILNKRVGWVRQQIAYVLGGRLAQPEWDQIKTAFALRRHFVSCPWAQGPLDPNWRPGTPPVDRADFATHSVVVLHYWATWNGADREMDRRLAQLRDEYAGRICFRSCDVDLKENRQLIQGIGIACIPAVGCFIRGRWYRSAIGLRTEAELKTIFDEWLAVSILPSLPTPQRPAGMLHGLRTLLGHSR